MKRSLLLPLGSLIIALLAIVALALTIGDAGNVWSDLWSSDENRDIFVTLRLPRVVAALLAGASLSVAGVLSQGLFRNPLASPSILGIEGGGLLAGALCLAVLPVAGLATSLPLATLAGCGTTTAALVWMAQRRGSGSMSYLLLLGIGIGAVSAALSNLVLTLAARDAYRAPMFFAWTMGSFAGVTWEGIAVATLLAAVGLIAASFLHRSMDVLSLGESVASTLGVSASRLQVLTVIAIALLVSAALSIGGALPFLGLIVPHICRRLVGPHHGKLAVAAALAGGALAVLADLAGRTLLRPEEVPVGVITALIGTPFFLYLAARSGPLVNRGGQI